MTRHCEDKDDYKGMSDEVEEEYNRRQNEPLFKSTRELIPMEQLKQYTENLICGYNHMDGCMLLKRDPCFYCCMWHQAMQAIGTDFFFYYKNMTDNDMERMTAKQHTLLEHRRKYMQKWMDRFPRGASG